MSILFSADEIFAIAEQIERNGARFYRRAGEKASDSAIRDIFFGLASLEDSHERTFARMREELTEQEQMKTTFDPEGETGAYLQAMADGRVFDVNVDPMQIFTGRETIKEVINQAIEMEKDSIIFYLGMKDMVPTKLGKDKIESIIREEMRHITVLGRELAVIR